MDDRTVVHYPMCVAQTETKTGWICRWSAVSKSEEIYPSSIRVKDDRSSWTAARRLSFIVVAFRFFLLFKMCMIMKTCTCSCDRFFFFLNFKSHSQQKDTGRFLRKRPTTNISNAFDLFRLACVGFFFCLFLSPHSMQAIRHNGISFSVFFTLSRNIRKVYCKIGARSIITTIKQCKQKQKKEKTTPSRREKNRTKAIFQFTKCIAFWWSQL